MEFSRAVGDVLRRARRDAGLTLHQVMLRSRGQFKPSVVGDYERGERRISVERFWQLASLYGIPADRLLGQALEGVDPPGRTKVVIDLTRLGLVGGEEGQALAEFVHRVKAQRGDYLADRITLRSGDIEALSLATQRSPNVFLSRIGAAIESESRDRRPAGNETR